MDSIWKHPTTGAKIYVGNLAATRDAALLASHNVRHIVNCTDDLFNELEGTANAPYYYMFNVGDWQFAGGDLPALASVQQLSDWVNKLFRYVDGALAAGESVMVHCLAGAHRAVTQLEAVHSARSISSRLCLLACAACRQLAASPSARSSGNHGVLSPCSPAHRRFWTVSCVPQGTTGVLLLMYKEGLPVFPAIATARQSRPVIDPLGARGDLVGLLHAYALIREGLSGTCKLQCQLLCDRCQYAVSSCCFAVCGACSTACDHGCECMDRSCGLLVRAAPCLRALI